MFSKVLIANRGAIACRIIRTLRRLSVSPVAIYSEADRHALHVNLADRAICVGPPPAAQSYLAIDRVLEAAAASGAEAIHPGYGFLSENAAFAERCELAGVRFIGPSPHQMREFGLKHTARELAKRAGVPLLPGTGLLDTAEDATRAAAEIGYPVMLKSTAGGGGIGMRLCLNDADLIDGFEAVRRLGKANFGASGVYLEKFIEQARHIEVQVFGDGQGKVLALGERDCSVQRRNQKVIEETPAPNLTQPVREQLFSSAIELCKSVGYRSAGTVEFIYDAATSSFFFLEVNTRLQVEHGVTEEVTGIDLVEWMVRLAAGELPDLDSMRPAATGCSIQVRVYAEDPARDFQPSGGLLSHLKLSPHARVESGVVSGDEITPYYDPMVAKIIVRGKNREEAAARLQSALDESAAYGVETNLAYLRQISRDPQWLRGGVTTSYLSSFPYGRSAILVHEPGTQSTVQDLPGRLGYWSVGVPPSGPMDSLAFELANRLVGNARNAAGLECTVTGPVLEFTSDSVIAITGADMSPRLDGLPVALWSAIPVRSGARLAMAAASGAGTRTYVAVRGGLDVPHYLGSRSTFILGRFGGHSGRVLRSGDVLTIGSQEIGPTSEIKPAAIPRYSSHWNVAVLYGPHGAPDFFTEEDIDMFFSTAWKVHYNSDRTGVRLIGPKPKWARRDGGEAGLHPSNIHDNAYAAGAVDFTGDMPVLLGPDGPSLGGFVCPATVVHAELWKLGQLKPGDTVSFHAIGYEGSQRMDGELNATIQSLSSALPQIPKSTRESPVLLQRPPVVCRTSGDRNLLIEYGPNVLDLNLRFRVHALEERIRKAGVHGIVDITPGIRSLQIHYDSRVLPRPALLEALEAAEQAIPNLEQIVVPTRIVHLPLSWDDPATREAIRKYTQSVRPDAPWCPSNIEFIRRINGLSSVDEVYRIVFDASYLVLGLGDVYLGAPVATPVDPRHRLVTTKYNPARTWTPENAVGIGGAYLCVYGMEGPGGYQFVGRTVQMWNTHKVTREFNEGTPWLLRFFDQIRFYPVSASELLEYRDAFPHGKYPLRIEEGQFRSRDYHRFLNSISSEAAAFKYHQQQAFAAEGERWGQSGQLDVPDIEPQAVDGDGVIPDGCQAVRSPITASVWNIAVENGQRVEAGQRLVILEAMKTEVAVASPAAGIIETLHCAQGAIVSAGQNLMMLRPERAL